ncbi:nuclear protein localization protein 4 NDAI_0C05810 [Naumovozyma dairenensis CBS 421]|uniref:Nuclear protein localization protein 4 n=1 Tax=Naumovozyma dairenensis (strain ATCC 10597 / BCRC 20456 / CBS 421 / NBRC 0211 / NRRL Y-12639) TaxID=1071378 RepID=G0W8X9_NAUDC|nr:hypothetical protein NDAI_0C05810 [Naumovozyma dairenensis CBS 421]CCD24240.1 hypothetical protein NDAI_0C05810 [Naumovozyma dairenensis CBS 421]
MLIRFRTKDGMQRIPCEPTDLFGTLMDKLLPHLNPRADIQSFTVDDKPGLSGNPVSELLNRDVTDLGLKHGDIVYVNYKEKQDGIADANGNDSMKSYQSGSVKLNGETVSIPTMEKKSITKELPIDEELEKEDGLIPRQRSSLCKHGDKGMCEYCSPLPPWDKEYHEKNNIKHISFHSYLKKLNQATNKKESGSSYIAPLSQPNFKIDKHCSNGHEPWPHGICSKCQPSAITLEQQSFRMVDHVEFQKSSLINEFIESWRYTGMQRFAFMYGSYEKYDSTPLGIKAIIEAIYEPPQHDEQDGLTLDIEQTRQEMDEIDKLAKTMGLSRVGVIFTDLTDAGNGDGSVFCKRHKDSFFLSSLEVIMAAKYQKRHPNVSKYSEQGIFSSKFVTCVVSGNTEGEIDISSYQVSTAAEALVDATMISGSTHPSMAYINETTNDRYVPEIFYMKKNEYGLTVKENAKPAFPVDYLLVSLTHGFPIDDTVSGKFRTIQGFPWANRQSMGQSQDYQELKKYIYQSAIAGDFNVLHDRISNFHFLLYVHTLQILSEDEWALLVIAASSKTEFEEPLLQLVSTAGWQTLVMILQESS